MNRQQKMEVVDFLKDNFSTSEASFLITVNGLTVGQMQNLRIELRNNGGLLKVAKGRLMKLAIQDVDGGAQELMPFCKNQVGLVFAQAEPPAVAKVLHDFAGKNDAFSIVVGCLESGVIDAASVARIALLPSKDVLRAQACGTLKMPIVGFVNVLRVLILRLLWVLKQISDKK